MQEELLQAILV